MYAAVMVGRARRSAEAGFADCTTSSCGCTDVSDSDLGFQVKVQTHCCSLFARKLLPYLEQFKRNPEPGGCDLCEPNHHPPDDGFVPKTQGVDLRMVRQPMSIFEESARVEAHRARN